MKVHAGELYLTAESAPFGSELWKTNGLPGGTVPVKDLAAGPEDANPSYLTSISASKLIFSARTPTDGVELFESDGTSVGTTLLADLNPGAPTEDSNPTGMHSVGGDYVLFQADGGLLGSELYRWDKNLGVTLVKDISPGVDGSSPADFTTAWMAGKLQTLFTASDGVTGRELWITDGTAAGTNLVKDIHPSDSSWPYELVYNPADQITYFGAVDDLHGAELWRTDGTTAGTWMVLDIHPSASSLPKNITPYAGAIVFSALDSTHGREPFISGGSLGTTMMLADLEQGTGSSNPSEFAELRGELLFSAHTAATGQELYTTDGTPGGTHLLVDANPGPADFTPRELTVFGDEIFFQGDYSDIGREFWRTDGTAAGTKMVADLAKGITSSSPSGFTILGDTLYFRCNVFGVGFELWKSDGTRAGTQMVVDINPGPDSSWPAETLVVGNDMYFQAYGPLGVELYVSDGTASGTNLVCDLNPGTADGLPTELVLCGGDLLFRAVDTAFGVELYSMALPGAYAQDLYLSGNGARLSATPPVLGGTTTIECEGAPAGSVSLLLMSAHIGTPNMTLVAAPSVSWIDPPTVTLRGAFTTESWSKTQPLPATPALVGVQVNLQAWFPIGMTFPAETSNGLHLVLGN